MSDFHSSTLSQKSFALKVTQVSLLLLPFTQFKWLPNLGLTRPLTAVGLVLAISLLFLRSIASKRWSLPGVFGWHVLRWYFLLLIFGGVSTLATLIYGDIQQAMARLLGYVIIFSMLYMAMYIFRYYSMERLAQIIYIGYLPALLYGIVEALAVIGVDFAKPAVLWVRSHTVVVDWWAGRLSLFATEPSFLAFQLLLLLFCLPFLRQQVLRFSAYLLIGLIVVFSQSLTVILTMVLYLGIRFFISGSTKSRILLLGAGSIGSSLLLMLPIFAPVAERLRNLSSDVSLQIRLGYIYALLYSILDTWGAGLGIGQYGLFWKDIYVAYIDYAVFDKYGEVAANLAGSSYMKPWSVVLGVGVDFGIIGLLVFLLFLYLVWKACLTPHDKAIFVTSFILIMGAYPIVTPHIWLVFAFIVAKGYSQHIVMHAAYQPKNSL